jgi:hypothetical protein
VGNASSRTASPPSDSDIALLLAMVAVRVTRWLSPHGDKRIKNQTANGAYDGAVTPAIDAIGDARGA